MPVNKHFKKTIKMLKWEFKLKQGTLSKKQKTMIKEYIHNTFINGSAISK